MDCVQMPGRNLDIGTVFTKAAKVSRPIAIWSQSPHIMWVLHEENAGA